MNSPMIESRVSSLSAGEFAKALSESLQTIKPDPNYPVLDFTLTGRVPLEMFGLTKPDLFRLVLIAIPRALSFGTRQPPESTFRFPEGKALELAEVVREFHGAVKCAISDADDVLSQTLLQFAQNVLEEFDRYRKIKANHARILAAGGR